MRCRAAAVSSFSLSIACQTAVAFPVALSFIPSFAAAQYYNTEGGRAIRVEDATPTEQRSVDFDLASFGIDRLVGNTLRYRTAPTISWGALAQTELNLRLPVVGIRPPKASGSRNSTGVAGLELGGMHAFNIETPARPAIAVATQVLLPVGGLASPAASYIVRALATQRLGFARFHLNVGAGKYSVNVTRSVAADTACPDGPVARFGAVYTGKCGDPPIIIDLPCIRSVSPTSSDAQATVIKSADVNPAATGGSPPAYFCNYNPASAPVATPAQTNTVANAPHSHGTRWFAGAAVDHAFALHSILVSSDFVIERFIGLYNRADATAEAGVRYQVSPRTVLDGGIGWHFQGQIRSVSVTLGSSIALALPLLYRSTH